MAQDMTNPDRSLVLDFLEAFRRSKTMFAAVSLGVFDALARVRSLCPTSLADSGQPRCPGTTARRLRWPAFSLAAERRALREYAGSDRLFDQDQSATAHGISQLLQ